jgi:hypothetical protein
MGTERYGVCAGLTASAHARAHGFIGRQISRIGRLGWRREGEGGECANTLYGTLGPCAQCRWSI